MSVGRPGMADYGLLLLLAAIWGSSFLFIKLAIVTLPPLTQTAYRMMVGALVLVPLARAAGQRLTYDARTWRIIALLALTGNALPFTLIGWGEEKIDSGLAAILMGAMPLYTILLAHWFTDDEKMTVAKLVGVAFGFAGLIVLIGPATLSGLGNDLWRQLAVAAAGLCYAINAVILKQLAGLPRLAAAAAIMLMSSLLVLPLSLIVEQPWTLSPSTQGVIAATTLGVVHTALGTLIMFALVMRQGAGFFGQINLLVPLFGVMWGVLFLAERPAQNQLLALLLILTGVVLARGLSMRGVASRS